MPKAAGKSRSVTPGDIIDAPEPKRRANGTAGPAKIARTYFEAVGARDVDGMVACWKPGGSENISAVGELSVPDGLRGFFTELFTAMPDARMEVLDLVAARNQAAVHWRSIGTFCGGPFMGIAPTGQRVEMTGLDLLTIEDGLIVRNDAFSDGAQLARQLGMLPPQDSAADRGMTAAFNARTAVARKISSPTEATQIADGVWLVRGGIRKGFNVYLISDGEGVMVFDAGVKSMSKSIATAAASLGGITKVLLGHAHTDHRGAAPGLRAPVWCHTDEVADAEGDGGLHYFDYSKLSRWLPRTAYPPMLAHWDGGPVKIVETVKEGDKIAGFEVVHFPGHAPGLIGLWRKSDRLAIVSDTVYFADAERFRECDPVAPHPAFNQNTEQAMESLRKLAALDPATVCAGHGEPLTDNVVPLLERAAAGWRPS